VTKLFLDPRQAQVETIKAGLQALLNRGRRGVRGSDELPQHREGDEHPDRDEAVLDLGIGESLLHAGAALGGEPLGALTEGVEVLGERIPRLLDLALDGVRVALHDAS